MSDEIKPMPAALSEALDDGVLGLVGDTPETDAFNGTFSDLARKLERQRNEARESRRASCEWTHDEVHGAWDAGCGGKWEFSDGGPAENKARFCPFCGGKINVNES